MTTYDRAEELRHYLWTLEILGEVLVNNDSFEGSVAEPQLTVRTLSGVHEAIRILARHAGEKCGEMMVRME